MGGDMWVTSTYGRGSQFYFTLTFKLHVTDKTETMKKMKRFRGRNILFLDCLNQTSVVENTKALNLNCHRISSLSEVANVAKTLSPNKSQQAPLVDTVIIDNMSYAEKIREVVHLRYTPIVLIAPHVSRLNMKLCIDLGITGYINSPVQLGDFAHTLLPALESQTTIPSDSDAQLPLNILLAEDNIVNQKLAVRILEKFGHKVETVANGKLAVEAFERKNFDMILMDVQMPVMGGFEATQRIRQLEQQTRQHIPIIALTAHGINCILIVL
jgi:osomolarity two-component system sensor histidine kinase NIK1